MTTALKPFLISEFKSGINTYLKPWIRPQDAFEPLVNAYVYRGVLTKRNGCTLFGNQLADTNPVMGLLQYLNESTGATLLVACTTTNAYLYTPGSTTDNGTFNLITSIGGANSFFWFGNVTAATTAIPASGTIPTFWQNLTPSSVTVTAFNGSSSIGTITDNGSGGWTGGTGIFMGASGTINYTTGAVSFTSVTIGSSFLLSLSITATTTGGYFTGNIKNFFNFTNWQPTSSETAQSVSYLYMVNNNDPLTIFDGTNLARPVLYVDSTYTPYIKTALDVKTYANRLLMVRPTISTESNPNNQSISFSALFSPFNFIGDIAGNGGNLTAATGDTIQTAKFLRDNLIVQFTNSAWSFQVSGTSFPPFIFRRLNQSKNCSCPYAGTEYDERVTNLGNTGFIANDGVNVQRFDVPIIDYYQNVISQQYFNQCFSVRYDNLNQTWMNYPSVANPNPLIGSVAPGSDQTLIYNFFENTWGTYNWTYPDGSSIPMTCLGKFAASSGTTWATATQTWAETQYPWFYYGSQASAPILLGGDVNGNVYHLDNAEAVQDGERDVHGEQIALGNGGMTYSGTLAYEPIRPGFLTITDGIETFVDNGNGTLTGSAGGTGTINYTTGAWAVTFHANVASMTPILASYTASGNSFLVNITTTRWNPFMTIGQKTQFSYIDIYYSISSDDFGDPIQLTLGFFVDNSDGPPITRTIILDGPSNGGYAFKRIYCNLIGEFFQMNIDPTEDAQFQILGFILWARPAGRFTPP